MTTDPAWQLELSYQLIDRTRAMTRLGHLQIEQSKATIEHSRRIIASIAPDDAAPAAARLK
jgi:hypothetical protein